MTKADLTSVFKKKTCNLNALFRPIKYTYGYTYIQLNPHSISIVYFYLLPLELKVE